jgi:MOSC domain-containing protein YiiM
MRTIISVNIGMPQEVEWQNKKVLTGIFKYPTDMPVQVTKNGIEGDGQADLIHHGGTDKAVYAYPLEHYNFWRQFLAINQLETGSFGENLTTAGVMDNEVYMGDLWQFGTAVLMAVQPRMPCSKLGLRFNNAAMTKYFARARRNGFYFRVMQEGVFRKGDAIHLVKRSEYDITIQNVVDCYAMPKKYPEKIKEIMDIPFLPLLLKSSFEHIIK